MDRFISTIAVLVVTMLLYSNTMSYNNQVYDYNKDMQLQHNVNMASDTALYRMMKESEDLGLDYYYYGRVSVNPKLGVDTFRRTLALLQYNIDSEEALGLIDNSYIGGIIICYDGYYLVKKLTDPLVKLPYVYRDNTGKRYLVNLTSNYITEVNISTGMTTDVIIPENRKSDLIFQIERLINKEVNLMVQNFYKDNATYEIYMPMFRRVLESGNAIDSTCCVFLVDNNDSRLRQPIYSVSGSSIVINRFCIGYRKGSNKYYTHLYNSHLVTSPIERMFMSPKDAAKSGYVYDITTEIRD